VENKFALAVIVTGGINWLQIKAGVS